MQVQHGAPGFQASGVEFARRQAPQFSVEDPASRGGPGEQTRCRTGTVEERAHPVEVVVISAKRRLRHRSDHRIHQAQCDAAPVPAHLDAAPRMVTVATAASGPM